MVINMKQNLFIEFIESTQHNINTKLKSQRKHSSSPTRKNKYNSLLTRTQIHKLLLISFIKYQLLLIRRLLCFPSIAARGAHSAFLLTISPVLLFQSFELLALESFAFTMVCSSPLKTLCQTSLQSSFI